MMMSLSKAQFYYSRLKVVSDEYRAKLDGYASDGLVDEKEKRQIEKHMQTFYDVFDTLRSEIAQEMNQLEAQHDQRTKQAQQQSGGAQQTRAVAQLKLAHYYERRALELIIELANHMVMEMNKFTEKSFSTARESYNLFIRLAKQIGEDLRDVPTPDAIPSMFRASHAQAQLMSEWRAQLGKVQAQIAQEPASSSYMAHLLGIQKALEYALAGLGKASGDNGADLKNYPTGLNY
jgi:tRNA isopentenyl-2-thiomethyl-A-37 hydroxylase MiaE